MRLGFRFTRFVLLAAWLAEAARSEVPAKDEAIPAPSFRAWRAGAAEDFIAQEKSTRPGLLMMGGAGDIASAWRWWVECAGGGDLVVLRVSGDDGYQRFLFDEIGGLASVTTLKCLSAEAAHDPAVLGQLAAAEAIFIAGGDQAKYVAWWRGTPLAAVLNAHLAAGKPIGGTSAGLAVMGEFYFSALHDTVTSAEALANPFDRKITLGTGFLTTPVLRGVITDSHFMARQRLGRLIAFLTRLQAEEPVAPRLVGLGVDEGTALCVEPDGAARVHTTNDGAAWLVQLTGPAKLIPGQPLDASAAVVGVGPQSTLNLRTLVVTAPIAMKTLRVSDGRLHEAR
jgi:beta-aspartyl-peptidase (threonine type)